MQRIQAIEGVSEVIVRERAVYKVACRALLLDLSEKAGDFPQLLDNDYSFTHQIGSRVHKEGHPGLLAPSARHQGKTNVVAFKKDILSHVRNHCYLIYELDPTAGQLVVSRQAGERFLTLSAEQFF
jgi:hypothetical protein